MKKLRVAACQLLAGEDIESNAKKIVDRLRSCARDGVDVAAFHEGVLYGYSCRPEFWDTFDQKRIEKAERRIVRSCQTLGIGQDST